MKVSCLPASRDINVIYPGRPRAGPLLGLQALLPTWLLRNRGPTSCSVPRSPPQSRDAGGPFRYSQLRASFHVLNNHVVLPFLGFAGPPVF